MRNTEKERHDVREMLFDDMRCVFSTLEKKYDFLKTGIVQMSKAIEKYEEKEKAIDVKENSKAV
ncbi:hypothetical protein ACEPPN_019050 [Leptodophora sp. 'Broadleaf-Isolate-01']